MFRLHIIPGTLTLQDIRRVRNEQTFVTLDESAIEKIEQYMVSILVLDF